MKEGKNMEFNSKIETEKIISFIKNYYKEHNLKGIVIGISGGKDSAVASALFTKALGKENVIGITMPCHSKEKDKSDAEIISKHFGFKLYNFDLTNTYDTFKENFKDLNESKTKNSDINLKPRLRMATLYYFAALLTEIKKAPYLVAGTGNKCEIYVGYFTKGGDGMSDINVLSNYTVSEVIKIGEHLNVPKEVLYKTPSDGLSKQTDEEKLGVTYKEIEDYLNGHKITQNSKQIIEKLHKKNKHKKGIVNIERI